MYPITSWAVVDSLSLQPAAGVHSIVKIRVVLCQAYELDI